MDKDLEEKAVDLWLSLLRRTQEYFDLGEGQWRYPLRLDAPKEAERERWLLRCNYHSDAIDEIIRGRLSVGAPTQENEELLYFVSVRYAAVAELLMRLVYRTEKKWRAVALPHSFDEDEVLDSLLLDWWHNIGKDHAFDHYWRSSKHNDSTE